MSLISASTRSPRGEQKKHKKVLAFNFNLCYSYIMRNSNIYKFTVTEYMQNPPSCGGNWECGETTYVYMSRSAKRATSMEGRPSIRETGEQGVPIMGRRALLGQQGHLCEWD